MSDATKPEGPKFNVKIEDEELKGRYSNLLRITHTRDEFILDFITFTPPQPVVTARVITSPGHMKRIVGAMAENLRIYEENFGKIDPAPEPSAGGEVN